eukprot:RCo021710
MLENLHQRSDHGLQGVREYHRSHNQGKLSGGILVLRSFLLLQLQDVPVRELRLLSIADPWKVVSHHFSPAGNHSTIEPIVGKGILQALFDDGGHEDEVHGARLGRAQQAHDVPPKQLRWQANHIRGDRLQALCKEFRRGMPREHNLVPQVVQEDTPHREVLPHAQRTGNPNLASPLPGEGLRQRGQGLRKGSPQPLGDEVDDVGNSKGIRRVVLGSGCCSGVRAPHQPRVTSVARHKCLGTCGVLEVRDGPAGFAGKAASGVERAHCELAVVVAASAELHPTFKSEREAPLLGEHGGDSRCGATAGVTRRVAISCKESNPDRPHQTGGAGA